MVAMATQLMLNPSDQVSAEDSFQAILHRCSWAGGHGSHTWWFVNMYIYIYIHIHTYIHTYIQTDRQTYIHTYIHKHLYIHSPTGKSSRSISWFSHCGATVFIKGVQPADGRCQHRPPRTASGEAGAKDWTWIEYQPHINSECLIWLICIHYYTLWYV